MTNKVNHSEIVPVDEWDWILFNIEGYPTIADYKRQLGIELFQDDRQKNETLKLQPLSKQRAEEFKQGMIEYYNDFPDDFPSYHCVEDMIEDIENCEIMNPSDDDYVILDLYESHR